MRGCMKMVVWVEYRCLNPSAPTLLPCPRPPAFYLSPIYPSPPCRAAWFVTCTNLMVMLILPSGLERITTSSAGCSHAGRPNCRWANDDAFRTARARSGEIDTRWGSHNIIAPEVTDSDSVLQDRVMTKSKNVSAAGLMEVWANVFRTHGVEWVKQYHVESDKS